MTKAREASHSRTSLSVCPRSQTPPLGVTGASGFVGESRTGYRTQTLARKGLEGKLACTKSIRDSLEENL